MVLLVGYQEEKLRRHRILADAPRFTGENITGVWIRDTIRRLYLCRFVTQSAFSALQPGEFIYQDKKGGVLQQLILGKTVY
ncbi:hypothetical protein F0562_004311 [Nyssa sinensis]|uniref:Uncharacterized protein n=1 Tax=Nyssa sinensis TaxID=561372 RepID=A0A5J5C1Q9_9ASTE|nr:hypothetical protein F0562_004311 [Nyssa sinensis]